MLRWVDYTVAKATASEEFCNTWSRPSTIPAPIRAALPALIESHEATLDPAPAGLIAAHLAKLSAIFPDTRRSEADWKAFMEAAVEDLAEYPADIVVEAIKVHRRRSKFYPAIAELREIASDLLATRQFRIGRMRRLLGIDTPEEKAEKERVAAALKAAEREAKLAACPHLRLADKWGRVFRFNSHSAWLGFLEVHVPRFGFDTVDRWHEQAQTEMCSIPDDPMPILCRKASTETGHA
jgi:hypothetical protein